MYVSIYILYFSILIIYLLELKVIDEKFFKIIIPCKKKECVYDIKKFYTGECVFIIVTKRINQIKTSYSYNERNYG
jgi:hypothetical protein